MPKVSIIIATHSRPTLLPRAIRSAQEAGSDVEVIVVDDASIDETASVCAEIEGIRYIRSEINLRTAGARNLGISASTSPYIGFLDDDDWRLPGSLEAQVAVLDDDQEAAMVYGPYFCSNQAGNVIQDLQMPESCPEGDLFWNLLRICRIGCLTAVFRREAAFEIGLLDVDHPGIDDWDFWVRLAERYPIRAVSETVAVWRKPDLFSGQGSSNLTPLFRMAAQLLVEKWLRLPRVLRELSPKQIERKRREILMGLSDQILNDMVRTPGTIKKMEKVAAALKVNPRLLKSTYFYKVITREVLESFA